MPEVVTFSHLDKADPMQAMNYLISKFKTFFSVVVKGKWYKPEDIIKEGEQILKAYDIVKKKYPHIADMFKVQVNIVSKEIVKWRGIIGGGANE